jgi:hypothetical protein
VLPWFLCNRSTIAESPSRRVAIIVIARHGFASGLVLLRMRIRELHNVLGTAKSLPRQLAQRCHWTRRWFCACLHSLQFNSHVLFARGNLPNLHANWARVVPSSMRMPQRATSPSSPTSKLIPNLRLRWVYRNSRGTHLQTMTGADCGWSSTHSSSVRACRQAEIPRDLFLRSFRFRTQRVSPS